MKFTKMHGIGNDYVYVNLFEESVPNPSETARTISDRHFGIGSDGLILIGPSDHADFEMIMYNSDGSRAQMCGNGIRCVGKYVYDKGLTHKQCITVETLGGIKELKLSVDNGCVQAVTVDMGEPEFCCSCIPCSFEGQEMLAQTVEVAGKLWALTAVSMGNPHAVTFTEKIDKLPLPDIGPLFEHHPLFPERVNTEFVEVLDRNTLKMRVWERGAGETLACGTGACAVLAAAVRCGLTDRCATVRLLGGDLQIRWDEQSNHIFMTGPASFVFEGSISI